MNRLSPFVVLLIGSASFAEKVVTVPDSSSEMVRVSKGFFFMGALDTERENDSIGRQCRQEIGVRQVCSDDLLYRTARPARKVYLEAFDIDRTEVTVEKYQECVVAGYCDAAPLIVGDTRYHVAGGPISNITWTEASRYCAFRGKRLPTEAEWEKTARGNDGRRFPWGNVIRYQGANHGKLEHGVLLLLHTLVMNQSSSFSAEYVEDESDGYLHAAPVGKMIWGSSPYGAVNMAGNVSEWVLDYYWSGLPGKGGYSDLPTLSPVRKAPKPGFPLEKVVRGGSWRLPLLYGRVYLRGRQLMHTRHADIGFRCAKGSPSSNRY